MTKEMRKKVAKRQEREREGEKKKNKKLFTNERKKIL